GLFGVVVGVVEVDDVDSVQAEPFQAGLKAAAYAVGAEVPHAAVGGGHGEAVREVVAALAGGLQDAADLGGDRVGGTGVFAKDGADSAFGQAEAVVRGGVEVADALLPGRGHRLAGLFLADLGVEVADGGPAEGEGADLDGA